MGAALAVPLIAQLGSAAISSQGSKKAAKAAGSPQIPAFLEPMLQQAMGLIGSRMQYGSPAFKGQRVAGPTGTQNLLLARGQGGLTSAFDTVRRISETGLDESSIRDIEARLDPFFERQRSNIQAGAREASAGRGNFFGSGSASLERDSMQRFEESRMANIIPLALQIQQQQLGAAGALPGLLGQSMSALDMPRQVNQANMDFNFAEFIRTDPANAINMLAPLLGGGGIPFFVPPVPTNFMQAAGAGLGNMASSTGFANLFAGTPGTYAPGGYAGDVMPFKQQFPAGGNFGFADFFNTGRR